MTINSPNTRIDARVVGALDLLTKAYIPRWTSLEWSEQINDVGSGTITMDFKDLFFEMFNTQYGEGALFNGTYAIQILREGTLVFTFMIEDTDVQRSGFVQEIVMAGRGIGAQLEWATVLPEGYHAGMNIVKDTGGTDTTFDREILSYEYLAQVATTTNLSSVYSFTSTTTGKLTASANGSINNLSIDGVTDLIVGSIVLVKNQSDAKQNGIYYVSVLGSAGTPWVLEYDADFYFNINFCYVGGNTYVQYGTTQKEKIFKITACPTSEAGFSSTNITFAAATDVYTAISLFYALFREADEGFEIVTTKGATWGNQITGYGRGGSTKAVDWALTLDASLTANKGLRDSKGNLPKDGGLTNLGRGQTLLQTLQTAAEQTECDWYVSPTGVISIARKPTVTNPSPIGTDRTTGASAMLLPLPLAASSQTKSTTRETRTVVYGTNSALIDVAESSTAIAIAGRRESYIENTGDDTKSATNIATTGLAKIAGAKLGIDIQFIEVDGRQAWLDFSVGDKILVEYEIGVFAERIISGISGSVDSSFTVDIQLTLDEIIPDAVTSLQNQSIYGTSQAAILRASLNNNRSSVPAPSVSITPVSTVSGMSNSVGISFNSPSYGRASSYEATVYRTSGMHRINGTSRTSGVATLTTADTHDYVVGDRVTVTGTTTYDVTDVAITAVGLVDSAYKTFSYTNAGANSSGFVTGNYVADGSIVITAISKVNGICTATTSRNHGFQPGQHIIVSDSGSTELDGFDKSIILCPAANQFTYSANGIDATSATGRVKLISEIHKSREPVGESNFTIQNLATSDRPYYARTASINIDGVAGLASDPTTFFSSDDAMEVVGGAIKSPNYINNSTGWIIRSDGSAEFGNVTVRGTMDSSSITGSTFAIGTGSSSFHVDAYGNIWSGSSTLTSTGASSGKSPFYVLSDGTVFARNARFSGTSSGVSEIQVGSNVGPGYLGITFDGITLDSATYNNAFVRSSAGYTYFNLGYGGANSLSFNTADGVLRITGTISGGAIYGAVIQNAETSPKFAVGADGNMKVNNIVASALDDGTEAGLQILANGSTKGSQTSTSGSIFLYSAGVISSVQYSIRLGTATRYLTVVDDGTHVLLGTNQSSLWIGRQSGTTVLDNVVIDRADLVLSGGAGDGSGNDYFSDLPTTTTATTYDAEWRDVGTEATWVLARNTSSLQYKENIQIVKNSDALNMIKSLTLKKFTYKKDKHDDDLSYALKQFDFDYGFIAEEVAIDSPELSSMLWSDEGRIWLKSYREGIVDISTLDNSIHFIPGAWKNRAVVGVLVGAIQELSDKVNNLESQLSNQ